MLYVQVRCRENALEDLFQTSLSGSLINFIRSELKGGLVSTVVILPLQSIICDRAVEASSGGMTAFDLTEK